MKMKKILLSLAIVLLSASGFAQPYRSYFGNEYTKWSVFCEELWDAAYSIEYALRPDATIVIDDVTYYKLAIIFMRPDTWSINVNDSYFDRYFLESNYYLREDQATGRLYVRTSSDTEEFIVSDMSLKVGDSIRLCDYDDWIGLGPFVRVVYDDDIPYAVVDSVYYADGLKHIHTSAMFHTAGTNVNLEFIEGIGSNLTPILNYDFYSTTYGMYCVILCYENETYWQHYPFLGVITDTCFMEVTGINDIKQAEIKVYPSPAEKYIYVDFDSRNVSDIIITNILGQVVKDISFEGTRTSIDVADLKSGIYFVKSGDSVVKFVKL